MRSGVQSATVNSAIAWPLYLVICAVGLTLALTWIGPRASEGLGTLNAMAFWAAHVFPALTLLATTQILLGRLSIISSLSGAAQVTLSAFIASVLFTPIALTIDVIFAAEGSLDDDTGSLLVRAVSEFTQFVVPLILTWYLINAPSLLQLASAGERQDQAQQADPKEHQPSPELTELWAKIPGRLGRELVALSAELHYTRVHTTLGETLVLFPFGRAVDLLQDANGMQIHRSHWVSLDQIDEVTTRNGRVFCKMIGGPSLPVSRSYRAALKAARRGMDEHQIK